MRPRDINSEAEIKRTQLAMHLTQAQTADTLAILWDSPAARIVEARLQDDIATWETVHSWATLDSETIREQGKALRSRELLEYFRDAKEAAEHHRAEAQRISDVLERAADQGRISRV